MRGQTRGHLGIWTRAKEKEKKTFVKDGKLEDGCKTFIQRESKIILIPLNVLM
jgi:hypothetical protein